MSRIDVINNLSKTCLKKIVIVQDVVAQDILRQCTCIKMTTNSHVHELRSINVHKLTAKNPFM